MNISLKKRKRILLLPKLLRPCQEVEFLPDEDQNKVEKTTFDIYKALKDETRLAIFLYLMINQKLTLKQLSEALDKGKTTIHHHIRKLEDSGIVIWEEKKEDKKKLKTRYYSLDFNLFKEVFGKETKK